MFSFFSSKSGSSNPNRRTRLNLEGFEERFMPATYTAPTTTPVITATTSVTVSTTTGSQPRDADPTYALTSSIRLTTITLGQSGFTTVQQALDRVAEGGTVYLEGKMYTENAVATVNVKIVGKAGSELKAADSAKPVITLSGCGGTVENVTLRGGSAGIKATGWDKPVVVKNVLVIGGQVGVDARMVRLTVQDSRIADTVRHGIDAYAPTGITVTNTTVSKAGGAGLYVYGVSDTNGRDRTIRLERSTFTWNEGCGVDVQANRHHIVATGCWFTSNRIAGMMLRDVSESWVLDSTFSYSRPTADGIWGDGLVVWGTFYRHSYSGGIPGPTVAVTGCDFKYNHRVAIAIKDAQVSLNDDLFMLNGIALNGEGEFDFRMTGPCTYIPPAGSTSTYLHPVTSVIQLPSIASDGAIGYDTDVD